MGLPIEFGDLLRQNLMRPQMLGNNPMLLPPPALCPIGDSLGKLLQNLTAKQ